MAVRSGVVTLLTDFGTRDGFTGAMKGRILFEDATLSVVDLTHDVPPGDVLFGAFALLQAAPFFPKGTVHCAVVDPGVGSARAAVAVECGGQFYVGPDNGLFSLVASGSCRIHEIDAEKLHAGTGKSDSVSPTFHGRDIFAPAAARIGTGVEPSELGAGRTGLLRLPINEPVERDEVFVGEVLHIDRFGNLITNLPGALAGETLSPDLRVSVGGKEISGLRRTFSDVEPGSEVAYVGSAGYLEVGVRDGNGARILGVDRGAPVRMWFTRAR